MPRMGRKVPSAILSDTPMAKQRNTPTASPPPTLGEGCLARYDPEALDDTDGTDFPGAAERGNSQPA
ncbi:hypothetical protein GLGCALEP_05378 [Pseudomonas sp. MM221]|nr:hypothetical protein GLGCALEP_05378 [Pseudomonas sp. MM221]